MRSYGQMLRVGSVVLAAWGLALGCGTSSPDAEGAQGAPSTQTNDMPNDVSNDDVADAPNVAAVPDTPNVAEPSIAPDAPDDSDAPAPATNAPLPRWCEVEVEPLDFAQRGTLAEVTRGALGETDEPYSANDLCLSMQLTPGSSSCPEGGPYFAKPEHEYGEISLLVPLEGGVFGRVAAVARYSQGTEEAELVEDLELRSTRPVQAYSRVSESSQVCIDDGPGGCGLSEDASVETWIVELRSGAWLRIRVRTDVPAAREASGSGVFRALPARVEEDASGVHLWACGGHRLFQLPAGSASPAEGALDAAAAASLCNSGWAAYRAGDLTGARVSVDRALQTLTQASDPSGLRSLGACLYNRGRIAQTAGEREAARTFYQRSLAARPNATVQARLESLASP